jgi:hypothetical protein
MQVMQINIHDSDISSSAMRPEIRQDGGSMSLGNGVSSSSMSSSSQSQPAKTNLNTKLFGK